MDIEFDQAEKNLHLRRVDRAVRVKEGFEGALFIYTDGFERWYNSLDKRSILSVWLAERQETVRKTRNYI